MDKIVLYGTYAHTNDTKLTFTKAPNRAEIELEFTGEDPDFGTEVLIDGGDANETMLSLCRDELDDISKYLDATHDGLIRTVGGYPELDDLNNSSLIAFERLLQTIVGSMKPERCEREFTNECGHRAMIAQIADVALAVRDYLLSDDMNRRVDIAATPETESTCHDSNNWENWFKIQRLILPFGNSPFEVALLMGYIRGGNVQLAYSYDDSDTQSFVDRISTMISYSVGKDTDTEVYAEFYEEEDENK